MKIILLGDLHAGARNDNQVVCNFQLRFLEEQLIPYMLKHKITTLVQFGDIFDRRKYTNHGILEQWKKRFFDVLAKHKIKLHIILGNHDIFFRNSLEISSPGLFLEGKYSNVTIYDKPKDVSFGKTKFLVVPWICSTNHADCMDALQTSRSRFCMGHFDISGFEMHAGFASTDGLDRKTFSRFDKVFSGHFHKPSSSNGIHYLGVPFQLTWMDYGDVKGFYTFDCDTHDLDFIPNTLNAFNRLVYDDKDKGADYVKGFDVKSLADTFVKIVVVNKTDPYQFEQLLDKVYQVGPADLKVVEDMTDIEADAIDDDEIELEDTLSLVESYVDAMDTTLDKEKLKGTLKLLYVEALNADQ